MNRFKTALIMPEALIKYEKDRIITVLLYLMVFALLTMVGPLVDGLTFERLPVITEEVILQDLVIPESCTFENNTLSCEETSMALYSQTGLSVTLHLDDLETLDLPSFETSFVLTKEAVLTIAAGTVVDEVTYATLDLPSTLNFSGTEQQQISAFFALANAVIVHYRSFWIPVLMITKFLSSMMMFLIFVFINALLIKPRIAPRTLKQSFVLMSYASTGLYLIWIFDSVITLNLFTFLILLIFAFRRTSRLALVLQASKPLENEDDL